MVGPTASGKTALAIELAKKYDGEIISADSRAVYKDMDIGTAKPTKTEQAEVPHWGIDIVRPGERFTVYDFKEYAFEKTAEIQARGKQPFVVGGTGLYIDALIYNYQFGQKYNDRQQMEPGYIVVGITTDRNILRSRIMERAEQMFSTGVVKETTYLASKYGWDNEAMKSNIYPIIQEMLDDRLTVEEAKQKVFFEDWHLARRQITWFKRNPNIHWLGWNDAKTYAENLLD
jgi:tRNA dimethylallyltransferase